MFLLENKLQLIDNTTHLSSVMWFILFIMWAPYAKHFFSLGNPFCQFYLLNTILRGPLMPKFSLHNTF